MNLEILRGRSVLLTGHTGFKGTWMCRFLNYFGAEVHGVSLPPEEESLYVKINPYFMKSSYYIDIRDLSSLMTAFSQIQPDVVIHMAAQPLVLRSYAEPILTFQTNVMGTAHVLQASIDTQSVQGVVTITSDKVYQNNDKQEEFVESDALGGKDPYSASKSAAEMVAQAYRGLSELSGRPRIITARAGNIIGGGDNSDNRLLPDILRSLEGSRIPLIRNPNALRPWQHVLDPLYGYLLLAASILNRSQLEHSYNFGPFVGSTKYTVGEVASMACDFWTNSSSWMSDPSYKNFPESQVLWINSRQAEEDLGWKSLIPVPDAIRWTLEWHKNHSNLGALSIIDSQIEKYVSLIS